MRSQHRLGHRPAVSIAVVAALACTALIVTAASASPTASPGTPLTDAALRNRHVPPTAAFSVSPTGDATCQMPNARPPTGQRRFVSTFLDGLIASYTPRFSDPNLAQLFANTLPNTLDTTVFRYEPASSSSAHPDAFVITGDITAMWLRDSANQVAPYVQYARNDTALKNLVHGVIARHARSILIDTHANAFNLNSSGNPGPHQDDSTTTPSYGGTRIDAMNPAIFERKYELDSLCNVLQLATSYNEATRDLTPFDSTFVTAVSVIIDTMTAQQSSTADDIGQPNYMFQRTTQQPTDTLSHGIGHMAAETGLIKSAFRPSDDATTLPFNIPSNAYAVVVLRKAATLLAELKQGTLADAATKLASTVDAAIKAHGIMNHPTAGKIFAYEVDGFGNQYFMDDANIPSLLSLPYLGYVLANDTTYVATRAAVLSTANPFYFSGSAAPGVGGPHNGYGWVWPMSLMMKAWTSTDVQEISETLSQLVASSSCTGLMHESFYKDSYGSFTRSWFAWANSLFGGLILKIAEEHPSIVFKSEFARAVAE